MMVSPFEPLFVAATLIAGAFLLIVFAMVTTEEIAFDERLVRDPVFHSMVTDLLPACVLLLAAIPLIVGADFNLLLLAILLIGQGLLLFWKTLRVEMNRVADGIFMVVAMFAAAQGANLAVLVAMQECLL